MRPCLKFAWAAALAVLAGNALPASAAWDNVFQVCCASCRQNTSNYVAPVPVPAPAPGCGQQTYYEKRYYYQPVTTYRTSTYYEPVTSYKTSYYYEPVQTVRYSTYYDPCSGCPQTVATPQTSYVQRSQTCPVTSYLQRTCQVPVVVQQQMFYYVPKTTTCTTTEGAPIYGGPVTGAPLPANPPAVGDTGAPAPGVQDDAPKPQFNPTPPTTSTPRLGNPQAQPVQTPRTPAADVPLDRVVSLKPNTGLEGRVIAGDNQAQVGARVLFINAANSRERQTATTDAAGQFQTSLAPGRWLVYVKDADGQDDFRQEIEVGSRATPLTLVKR